MSPYYLLGYRAGRLLLGSMSLPIGLTGEQGGQWIEGFIRGSTDAHRRMAARFEPEVAAVMQRKQETAG